jgi:hypothetical protein
MTTIKFDDLEHTGPFSQDYVDGFVFVYNRINHRLCEEELKITVTGDRILQFNMEGNLGCCPYGTGPGSIDENDITDEDELLEYIIEFTEMDTELDEISRYIATIYIHERKMGGYGRIRSFEDLFTFDNLDYMRGVRACASFFDHVNVDVVLDTHTFKIL